MTTAQEKARQNLIQVVGYFRGVAEDCGMHFRRKIEYDIALATANLISAKNRFGEKDFLALAHCINQIVGQDHANGSGWMDFQIKVELFFYTFGYQSEWNTSTGEFTFWKKRARFWDAVHKWLGSF